jgi:Divergent InlB B-repeat domain
VTAIRGEWYGRSVRHVSISLAALLAAALVGILAPSASAAPTPSHWCGTDESTEDRLPDAVASYQLHVVYAIPADGADQFSQRVLPIARDLAAVDTWWRLQDPGRTPRFDRHGFPGCDSDFGALDISVVRLSQPGAAYQTLDPASRIGLLRDLAAALSSPAKKFVAFYDGPIAAGPDICGFSSRGPTDRGGSYSVILLNAAPAGGLCGNLGAGDYMAKTETHEILHNLGAVPDEAPHQCNGGHVCDSGDVMASGGQSIAFFNYAMDVGHDDYYGHSGSWWDVQDSLWLSHVDAPTYPLVVKIEGGKGSVDSDLPGIQCPPACTITWESGSELLLTATPEDDGAHFVGFAGDCSGDACALTMDGPKTVTARFVEARHLHLAVVKRGGDGSITGPLGIGCDTECDFEPDAGTTMTLRAVPARGSRLLFWSIRSCGSRPVCRFSVDDVQSVTATFGPGTFRLTAVVRGSGTVRSTPAGILCPRKCSGPFPYGRSVALKARPAAGWKFVGWSGGCRGVGPCRIRITRPAVVRAAFRRG